MQKCRLAAALSKKLISVRICFRIVGLQCRSWSCKPIGKKFGIRRIRRSLRFRKGCEFQEF
jgi:hypothetical protein